MDKEDGGPAFPSGSPLSDIMLGIKPGRFHHAELEWAEDILTPLNWIALKGGVYYVCKDEKTGLKCGACHRGRVSFRPKKKCRVCGARFFSEGAR